MKRHVRRLRKEYHLLKRSHNASVEGVDDNRILTEAREKWKAENRRYKKSVRGQENSLAKLRVFPDQKQDGLMGRRI